MRIWFLARQSLPFSPLTYARQALGGSETALFLVARGLAALGHEVVVLNHCGAEAGVYDGVRYLDLAGDRTRWQAMTRTHAADVLVLFRRMLDVTTRIPSRARVFWAHDHQGVMVSQPQSAARSLGIAWRHATGPMFHQRVDRIFVVSQFMADLFRWLFRAPADKLAVMPNGIEVQLFTGPAPARRRMQFIHSSVPGRGLVQLLQEIFPPIRRVHPEAELHLFSYRPLEEHWKYGTAGVHFLGSVPKEELVSALRESTLMLYPSNFEEMGAISVLESMAAGTPAVTSTLGVLSELTGEGHRGIAVSGQPGSGEFAARFVEATLSLLEDAARVEAMRVAAREYVLARHDWNAIALRWDRTLRDLARRS